ncbi:hypothetical protein ES703_110942 [subsurface metagenome]
MEGTHKILIVAIVKDDADYKVIQRNIADFPEVVDVKFPMVGL